MPAQQLRRVVTGHDKRGRSVVSSDEMLQSTPFQRGWNWVDLWAVEKPPHFPDDGSRPNLNDFIAPPGGFRCLIATIDPHTDERGGGLSKVDSALFHRTATIDMAFVISGSCVLELDEDAQIQLNEGDTLVQCGTMHAWRNPFDSPCRLLFTMIGARNDLVK
jgi:cupin domain